MTFVDPFVRLQGRALFTFSLEAFELN